MIVGSGLLAKAFTFNHAHREDVCIYAAGVSNSNCTDPSEFERERSRLASSLTRSNSDTRFVYFSTCSVYDDELLNSPYVRHKLAMEKLVAGERHHLILRLPQVAGQTPNPHTLLNYLYARISRGEKFHVWSEAYRNVIDVEDVAVIADAIINDSGITDSIINIANTDNYAVLEIVQGFERVLDKEAVFDYVTKGHSYSIDVNQMLPLAKRAGVVFGDAYLDRVINRYYGTR